MIRRTVLEWQSLRYGLDEDAIPEDVADRIAAVAALSPLSGRGGGGVLEHGRKALRARGIVGIIAAQGSCLEILPKIEESANTGETSTGHIRKRLIHMLSVALDIRIEAGSLTELDWQRDTLLEILIKLFTTKLIDAVRHGMPRNYTEHTDDLPMLRGQLQVLRQFTTLIASPQKLACRYDALTEDIPLNQVIKAAIARLAKVAQSPDTQQRLREVEAAFEDVTAVPIAALSWSKVIIDRTNSRWRELLDLARLLLGDRFQTTSAGAGLGFSLLFEMNTLFEEYVARLLARALAGTGRHVKRQGGGLFCLESAEKRGTFKTKPDILVKRGSIVEQIIDTKWKRIAARIDDPKQGVTQADIYQMMAYAQLYQCPRLTLLYPHHHGLGVMPLVVSHRIAVRDGIDRLELATVDVSTGHRLVERLATLCSEEVGWTAPRELA